jgi:hypothetical protein
VRHSRAKHGHFGRKGRLVALVAGVGGLAAGAVMIAGSAGAHQTQAVAVKVTAKRVTARAVTPTAKVTDVATVQQADGNGRVQSRRHTIPFLSPLGAAGLKAAKATAKAHAAFATQIIPNTPGKPNTPDGALQGIEGMKDSETVCAPFGCQPPDHAIAANENYVVQVVNTALLVYDAKKGKAKGKPIDLGKFFKVPAPAPKGCDPDDENLPFLSDPRAFFDPSTNRFVVAVLQVEGAPGFGIAPDCDFVSRYWVAVSKNDNPSGKWYVYGFDTSSVVAAGGAADYTQLGFDGEAIFIGGNEFDATTGDYNGAWTLAIPKATAEAGGAIPSLDGFGGYTADDGTANPPGRLLDTVQPVVSLGDGSGGPPGEILIGSFNESADSTPPAPTENKVVLFDFSNALEQQGSGQTLSQIVLSGLDPYAQPPLADDYPDCTDCLETIDNRISATPVYMHGKVYATHDSAVDNGDDVNANVQWMIVKPVLDQPTSGCTLCTTISADTTLDDSGFITYPGSTDTWFGAIQPDREGNPFIGFEYGSTTGSVSPSSAFVARRVTATSFDDGQFLRVATNGTDNSRWGDYEAVTFDGWDSNNIWFATEYSDTTRDWGTHLDKVKYTSLGQQ